MAQITVGTTAVALTFSGRQQPVIQNLGPGIVEVDRDPALTFGTGIQIAVGAAYEFPGALGGSSDPDPVYIISDTIDTDVRTMY